MDHFFLFFIFYFSRGSTGSKNEQRRQKKADLCFFFSLVSHKSICEEEDKKGSQEGNTKVIKPRCVLYWIEGVWI